MHVRTKFACVCIRESSAWQEMDSLMYMLLGVNVYEYLSSLVLRGGHARSLGDADQSTLHLGHLSLDIAGP
jgi:hypothetical protein